MLSLLDRLKQKTNLSGGNTIIVNRYFVQMPISDEPPPIPKSMWYHYKEGELDEDGYVIAQNKNKI